MKKILLPALLTCVLLQIVSCKEVVPVVTPVTPPTKDSTGNGTGVDSTGNGTGVDSTGVTFVGTDTTYVATVEAKQDRVVMIEEFTGVSCPPCPNGHQVLAAIYDAHPGRVAIMGIQPFNVLQANPVVENGVQITVHDNRNQKGTDIATYFGGLGVGIPTAVLDRQYSTTNGSYYYSNNNWAGITNSRLSVATPLNIILSSSVNNNVASIKVKVAYTEAIASKQYLIVAITEDSVIDAQKNGLDVDEKYVHMHLLRDILTTGTPGTNILGSYATIQAGRVYATKFTFNVNSGWNPDHCHVIAYVVKSETGNKEVQQAAVTTLK